MHMFAPRALWTLFEILGKASRKGRQDRCLQYIFYLPASQSQFIPDLVLRSGPSADCRLCCHPLKRRSSCSCSLPGLDLISPQEMTGLQRKYLTLFTLWHYSALLTNQISSAFPSSAFGPTQPICPPLRLGPITLSSGGFPDRQTPF